MPFSHMELRVLSRIPGDSIARHRAKSLGTRSAHSNSATSCRRRRPRAGNRRRGSARSTRAPRVTAAFAGAGNRAPLRHAFRIRSLGACQPVTRLAGGCAVVGFISTDRRENALEPNIESADGGSDDFALSSAETALLLRAITAEEEEEEAAAAADATTAMAGALTRNSPTPSLSPLRPRWTCTWCGCDLSFKTASFSQWPRLDCRTHQPSTPFPTSPTFVSVWVLKCGHLLDTHCALAILLPDIRDMHGIHKVACEQQIDPSTAICVKKVFNCNFARCGKAFSIVARDPSLDIGTRSFCAMAWRFESLRPFRWTHQYGTIDDLYGGGYDLMDLVTILGESLLHPRPNFLASRYFIR
ncbi:hypothetical protein BDZ89DRAFT_1044534 [Hymenopellis radicata]|nr:hypothetical protein BDZ89DRAFT_1044534 [Hymenopellis radicata]